MAGSESDRRELQMAVFDLFDCDGDGRLNTKEMRAFACMCGFEGSKQAWAREYGKLCSEWGLNPKYGVPAGVVLSLMDDETEAGCYCTDDELSNMAVTFGAAKPMSRRLDDGLSADGVLGQAPGSGNIGEPTTVSGRVVTLKSRQRCEAERGVHADDVVAVEDRLDMSYECHDPRTVFFAGAPPDTPSAQLRALFEGLGRMTAFRLLRSPDGTSLGMGVVRFRDPWEAVAAAQQLAQECIAGCSLWVTRGSFAAADEPGSSGRQDDCSRIARPSTPRVLFWGAPRGWSQERLQSTFAQHGPVTFVDLFRNGALSEGAGICVYGDCVAAHRALRCGVTTGGWRLRLAEARPAPEGARPSAAAFGAAAPEAAARRGTHRAAPYSDAPPPRAPRRQRRGYLVDPERSVFFRGMFPSVTETSLRLVFAKQGALRCLKLFMASSGASLGKGIVEYERAEDARRAYDELHGAWVGRRRLCISEFRSSDCPDLD